MKRFSAIAMIVAILGSAGPVSAGSNLYEWTLSYSNTDSRVHQGAVAPGVVHIYVWHVRSPPDLRMAAVDLTVSATGGYTFLAANVQNGFLNAGSGNNLLLAVGGCPVPEILAVDLLISDDGNPGEVCFTGNAITVDCGPNDPYDSDWTGCNSMGTTPCSTISVDPVTWGGVKALYR